MKEKDKTKNKLKLYRLLGAEQFQKVVFLVEKIKYKVIKKLFPNIINWYEKQVDKNYLRKAKKTHQEESIDLLHEYQTMKLEFRKEMIYEKNRNYHYDPNYPTKFIKYLEINKKIHVNGLKNNIIALGLIGIFSLLFGTIFPLACISLAAFQIICLVINFECINLQNYNLCRFQNNKIKTKLKKTEEEKISKNLNELSKGMKPVVKTMEQHIEIPTIDQVIDNINSREEATELLKYAKEQLTFLENGSKINSNKQKKLGGNKNG